MDKRIKGLVIAAFWLIIWQIAAILINNRILLVGPAETAAALLGMLPRGDFWLAVLGSVVNISLGFFLGSALGLLLAWASYIARPVRELISPLIGAVKAVPVVSFVIIALIWAGSGRLSLIVTLTVTLPIIYLNALEGLMSTDKKLLELAEVYRMGPLSRLRGIYLPGLYPHLLSAVELAVGMAWKSGIAAEVIGQPVGSLGNELYRAKIYLETDKVLAVSALAVFLSWLLGRAALALLSLYGRRPK